jgi:hypothetical protein
MPEQSRAEFNIDAIGGVSEYVGPQDSEDCLKQRNRNEPNDQYIERTHAAMDEDFVDHDLEEERRDERE